MSLSLVIVMVAYVNLKATETSIQRAFHHLFQTKVWSKNVGTRKESYDGAGAAMCAMAMGRFEDAEKELLEALQRDSKDPDTLHNLAVCALHLGKPATRFFNQLKTLAPKPGAVEKMESLEKMFDAANEQMASA